MRCGDADCGTKHNTIVLKPYRSPDLKPYTMSGAVEDERVIFEALAFFFNCKSPH
jgi:hypothetical protein